MSQLWEVVGGADTGGIVVREGKHLESPALGRLLFGATVREVELDAKRVKYKKVTGVGPDEGWISISSNTKVLLVKIDKEPEEQAATEESQTESSQVEALKKEAKEESAEPGSEKISEDWYVVPTQTAPRSSAEEEESPAATAQAPSTTADPPTSASTSHEEIQVPASARVDETSNANAQSISLQPTALSPFLSRPLSPLLFLHVPRSDSRKSGDPKEDVKPMEDVQREADAPKDIVEAGKADSIGHVGAEASSGSWLGKAFSRIWRQPAEEEDGPEDDDEDEELESDAEDSEAEQQRKLPRERRKCCSPGCPYRVHTLEAYGSFCCIACFETSGYDHGHKCERIRWQDEEETKEEEQKEEAPQEEDDSEDEKEKEKEKAEADAKKKAQEEKEKAKDDSKLEESQEEKAAKVMIETAKTLATKLRDLASSFLVGGSSPDEDSKEVQVLKDIARKHQATGKLDLAKKLQEAASALLKDGIVAEVEKFAKKMQDAAFGLLKETEPETNEDEAKKDSPELKHANSELKEEKAKTPEYWRKEVARQRRTGTKDDVLKVLHEAAPALLKEELVEETQQLALRMQKLSASLLETSPATVVQEDAQAAQPTETASAKSVQAKELQEVAAELSQAGVIKDGADLAKKMQELAANLQQEIDGSKAEGGEKEDADGSKAEGALKAAQVYTNLKEVSRRMRDGATTLLKGGVIEEARIWAKETERDYRKIGSRWRLGVALSNIATAHLRMLEGPYTLPEDVLDPRTKSTLQDRSERCREALAVADEAVGLLRHIGHPREELDLAAARSALSKLRDLSSKDEVLQAKEDFAQKSKVAKDEQSKEEGTLKSWRKTVSKQRAIYEQAPTGRGNHKALATTLQQAASFFLKKGGLHQAAAMAEEAASLYQKTGDVAMQAGALDICARAHLKLILEDAEIGMSALIERQNLLKAKTAASEAVSTLGKRKVAGLEYALAACYCTLTRVHALELNEKEDQGLIQSVYQTLVSKFRGSGRISLQRSFGYAAGLSRPPKFARFDIREDVCLRVGGFKHGQVVKDPSGNKYVVVGVKFSEEDENLPQLYFQPKSIDKAATCCFTSLPVHALKAVLALTSKEESVDEVKPQDFDVGEDSDGEMVTLCHECLLPLGGAKYASPDGDGFCHGECMARILLDKSHSADKNREMEDNRRKVRDREEYNIGWRADRMIPRNDDFLRRAKVKKPPGAKVDSMYALVLESGSPTKVRLVPTADPEAFVNLNYLMLALQVRIKANMAPYFSLDSVSATDSWQCKVFGPPWLKGTAVGEILFQADYHLKELSMGDSLFDQPVVGMKSCWDYSWKEEGWRGREWFVVKNAKVNVSDTNVLVPHVQMGVEAREQVANHRNELVDAPVTSTNHPLVKYAEEFSHYFDLVAERKSVIFQLREVSRAAIMAKFLVDNKVSIDDLWLAAKEDASICKMDMPFNKQERYSYNIMVMDGTIKEQHGGVLSGMVGLYGGVDLNIEAFDLTLPGKIFRSIDTPDYAAIYSEVGHMGTADELTKLSQRELRKLVQEAGGEPPIGPTEKSDLIDLLISLRQADDDEEEKQEENEQPKEKEGLEYLTKLEEDLRKLSLSPDTVRSVLAAIRERAGAPKAEDKASKEKLTFWDSMNDESNTHAALFKSIFRSRLADREQERSFFIPPVTKETYLKKLQGLVDEEKARQEKRRKHFLGKDFVSSRPGDLFPSSWQPNFQMHLGRGASVGAGGDAARGKRLIESNVDGSLLIEGSKPVFDKKTEDFTRFRIYRRGNIEVRTIQEDESSNESVGVVFEITAAAPLSDSIPAVKVTEFVKSGETLPDSGKDAEEQTGVGDSAKSPDSSPPARSAEHTSGRLGQIYCYFVLYETDLGDVIVTEQLPDGSITWEENPADMDERFSRARVLRVTDCSSTGATVGSLRQQYQEAAAEAAASADSVTRVSTRRYAERAFEWPGGSPIVSDESKPQKAPEMKPLPTKENAEREWAEWNKAASKESEPAPPAAGAPRSWLPQMFGGQPQAGQRPATKTGKQLLWPPQPPPSLGRGRGRGRPFQR